MRKNTKIAELTKELMEDREITDVANLQSMLKEMLKNGVETILEAELDNELGYERYDNSGDKSNYRNDSSKKKVRSYLGELELNIPRDRNNDFDPQLDPKNSRDISDHIEDIYGIPLSA